MSNKCLLLIKFYGPEENIQEICSLLAKYEQCGTQELQELAISSGLEKTKVNYFLDDDNPAKLLEVCNYGTIGTATFAAHEWSSDLLVIMAQNIKGECKCAWECWGNSPYSARFYDEDLKSYTEEVLVRSPDAYNDEEDYNLVDEYDDEFYYERDTLESAIVNWCSYNDFEREDQSDEQMLEIMQENNVDNTYQVYPFVKLDDINFHENKALSKVIYSGDIDAIDELYNAANDAIEDHNGRFTSFVDDYNEDDDYCFNGQILDAQMSENDDGQGVLELNVLSYFNAFNKADRLDIDVFSDFNILKSYLSDNNDVELTLNIWQVTDCEGTGCELERQDETVVGYLSVDGQDEFGKEAKFLMCDHINNLIDRWCELVGYEGEREEYSQMLELINNYNYQNANTKIKAGIIGY